MIVDNSASDACVNSTCCKIAKIADALRRATSATKANVRLRLHEALIKQRL